MSYNVGPSLVAYNLSAKSYEYLMLLVQNGMLTGPIGNMQPPPAVAQLFEALHAVLAGGSVTVTINSNGSPTDFNQMQQLLADAQAESNTINQKAGYYLTIIP